MTMTHKHLSTQVQDLLVGHPKIVEAIVHLNIDCTICVQLFLVNKSYIEQCYPAELSNSSAKDIADRILNDFAGIL